jgi:tetratricopeptide (TPR) repeat protein
MSYIHEALNKAQKERDARHGEYSGVLARRKLKKGFLPRRSVLWITFSLVVIFLAFASYSWLDSEVFQPTDKPVRSEHKYRMPAATQKSGPTPATGAKGFYERGNVFHRKGRLREAKRLYREALRRDPGHVDSLNNLAVIYMREKNYSAAERSLEKAIRLKPRNVDPHYNLACVYAIKGELSKSLAQLKRAGTLDPSVKTWALNDSDLRNAQNDPEFEKIIKK